MPCTSVKISEKKEPVILTMIDKHIKHEMAESPQVLYVHGSSVNTFPTAHNFAIYGKVIVGCLHNNPG